ncbi:N-acetyltransferase [bacterium]|nr:MAG: N-acetyltransferase [bacterium]
MAFGPIMRLSVSEIQIELAPLRRDDMPRFIDPGMQEHAVTKYLTATAKVLEDEYEWYEKVRTDTTSIVWGIWVIKGTDRTIIGTSALNDIRLKHTRQATSGSMIFDQDYWGKGIAKHIHMARTWYAFRHMGLQRVKSAVIQGNVASLKALQRSGYELVYVERNDVFVDGQLRHVDALECINPAKNVWREWWHGDRPTKKSREARIRTQIALQWASENVKLS